MRWLKKITLCQLLQIVLYSYKTVNGNLICDWSEYSGQQVELNNNVTF